MPIHPSSHTGPHQASAPPSLLHLAMEMRAPWEMAAALAAIPFMRGMPPGDGHPVLVLPGLAAGDYTTVVLRKFIQRQGYSAQAWEQGANFDPRPGVLEACVERVRQLHAEHGRRVSLVGWSLGGMYARELAKMLPEHVRQVISLGTPFTGSPRDNNAWRVYRLVSGEREIDAERYALLRESPGVPTTSIFSRTDGVVAWHCSVEQETAHLENIEVHASHIGLGANPTVRYAIADRLAQPEGAWQRFDRRPHVGLKKLLFRDPHRAHGFGSLFGW